MIRIQAKEASDEDMRKALEELKGATDHIISLIPQGKGRQPKLEID